MTGIMENIKRIIKQGAATAMTDLRFLELEIAKWKRSKARAEQVLGEKYYDGEQDILNRTRVVIGEKGELSEVVNLPNNKILDNQYAKMVDQKVNYLLGKPLTFDTDNDMFKEALQGVFDKRFHRTLKSLGYDSLNGAVAWLHPYYDENAELRFKCFSPMESLPFWRDSEHTELDLFVRVYEVEAYKAEQQTVIERVEIYGKDGIQYYVLNGGTLVPDETREDAPYFITQETAFNWNRIPVIPFKYNSKEIPLIRRVKSLQDGINTMLSDFENNMQEDSRNTILVLKNYDGTDLGEFRQNLSQYGVVKVRTVDGGDGAVESLSVEVNSENYKSILELFKKALIENAKGYDAKDERMSGTPNQMNIQSMYSDIDLDANGMETEYQASFEELLWFIRAHFARAGIGNFEGVDVNIIFNRDMLMNEGEIITNIRQMVGLLSEETLIAQVPWNIDVKGEMKRIEAERQRAMDQAIEYGSAFGQEDGDGVNAEP